MGIGTRKYFDWHICNKDNLGRSSRNACICLIGISLILSACGANITGSKGVSVPKLKEPAALNEAYRTVGYGQIGTTDVLLATAVPRDYCHYYSTGVSISRIYVEPGDMVKEGDLLAECDVDEAKEQLESAKQELEHENDSYEISVQISDAQIEQSKQAVKSEADNSSNNNTIEQTGAESDTDYEKQIATERENADYNRKLHEYRVQKINDKIAEYQKLVDDGTLTATHSGLVTYTKRITGVRTAQAYENIAVISDMDDLHLQVKNTTAKDFKYEDYDTEYVLIAGEKHDITIQDYPAEAMVLANINKKYPYLEISCNDPVTLEAGQMYQVYFQKKKADNTLVVGNDSLYKDDDSSYVYVKTTDNSREKRIVETGESDKENTQILGGLKEGEEVYYNSTDKIPTDYSEYTVSRSDFSIPNYGTGIGLSDAGTITETASFEGQIASINVAQDDEVEKGTLLYVIDTGEGRAAITEAKNAIDSEKESYKARIAELDNADADEQNEELHHDSDAAQENITELQKKLATVDHTYRLAKLQSEYDRISKDNDGKGNISVYAQNDGKVAKIMAKEGDTVEAGTDIMQISGSSTDILLVKVQESKSLAVHTDNIADIGEQISIYIDGTNHTGTCVGFAVYKSDADKGYVVSDADGVHVTSDSESGYGVEAFYVKMDDGIPDNLAAAKSADFSYVSVKDAIVLPDSMIHKQVNPLNESDVSYYVWKADGENVVKQFVEIADFTGGKGTLVFYGINDGDVLATY